MQREAIILVVYEGKDVKSPDRSDFKQMKFVFYSSVSKARVFRRRPDFISAGLTRLRLFLHDHLFCPTWMNPVPTITSFLLNLSFYCEDYMSFGVSHHVRPIFILNSP